MTDITVRSIRFSFENSLDLDRPAAELSMTLPTLALSMTMPYLEPYLIRTMKVALKQITDPELSEDVRRFSQQEGHHFRNHAVLNDEIRAQFDAATTERLRGIEAILYPGEPALPAGADGTRVEVHADEAGRGLEELAQPAADLIH